MLSNTQLFPNLDAISSQNFSSDGRCENQIKFDEEFSQKFCSDNSWRGHDKLRLHVPHSSVDDSQLIDIDTLLQSQLNDADPLKSYKLPSPKRPKCFLPPFSQRSAADIRNQTLINQDNAKLTEEQVAEVDRFVHGVTTVTEPSKLKNKHSRQNFHKPNKTTFSDKSHLVKGFQSSPLSVVPETPQPFKTYPMPSHLSSSSGLGELPPDKEDIIFDSDEENRGTIYGPVLQTPSRLSLPPPDTPSVTGRDGIQLRSVDEIPEAYRAIFSEIQYFNIVQSKVFDDVLYTDKPLVVCAPTGSGKTMIFELAITRLLMKYDNGNPVGRNRKSTIRPKIVYMAPIKALCSERNEAWSHKFNTVGLNCQEMTGDSDIDEFWQIQKADIILTTPEKWDSMTRRWRDNTSLVQKVQLFLIDEVHLLNDETRGATMEAVVSRMKTVQSWMGGSEKCSSAGDLRLVAVSATIPNTEDVADWLGTSGQPAAVFNLDDSYRPVALRKVVLGYPWSSNGSEFKFDISLNYKLKNIIQTYSEEKPTLVFCATRKSVEQAASTLAKDVSFIVDASHKQILVKYANLVRNHRLRELLMKGIGYHHAGLDSHDRHIVEEIFTQGGLLVLVSTSTLAMGVNLPAHLVVIKSTCHYVQGMFQEYTQSEILQMIGRAGRPQFDTSATAVIMTRNQSRNLYHNIVNGSQKIESSMHKHLIEHLNAEIVLTTIRDVTIALEWIRSTFLYIRILKNPTHYGYPKGLSREDGEKRLYELCMHNLNSLAAENLTSINNDLVITSTEPGRLMARYCIAFDTIKKFSSVTGTESLQELITILSGRQEFQEVNLRMNERTTLNKMNKDKNRITIRYPMNGRIKTTQMKVSCLMQATLGCISIQDFTLTQDVTKIFRNAVRVCRCLVELLMLKDNFKSLYNAAILSKCVKARLWENSRYVTKQLPSIGPSLSSALANAGVCSFEKLEQTDPREIELIVNRNPPYGNHLCEAVKCLPKYTVHVEQNQRYGRDSCEITVQVLLSNAIDLQEKQTAGKKHGCFLFIGDADNQIILKQRLSDYQMINSNNHIWQRTVSVKRAQKGDELSVNLISHEWVGLDVESTYTPYYIGPHRMIATAAGVHNDVQQNTTPAESKYFTKKRKPCRHTCNNKRTCAHECCKASADDSIDDPIVTSATKRTDVAKSKNAGGDVSYLQKFSYDPRTKYIMNENINQVVPPTPSSGSNLVHLESFKNQQLNSNGENTQNAHRLTPFEQEQCYYEDQINLGSRITYNKQNQSSFCRHAASEQLWSESSNAQDIITVNQDDLIDINPRPSKYSFKHLTTPTQKQETTPELKTPARLGKVFAWKSSTSERNNFSLESPQPLNQLEAFNKERTTLYNPWQGSSGNLPTRQPPFTQYKQLAQQSTGSVHNQKKFEISSEVQTSTRSRFIQGALRSSQKNKSSQPVATPAVVNAWPPKQNMSNVYQTSSNQVLRDQLWEQAPSCDYTPCSTNMNKQSAQQLQNPPNSQNRNDSVNIQNESDISIHCDFDLEDTADDLILMEACMQAEELDDFENLEELSPEVNTTVQHPSSPASVQSLVMNAVNIPEPKVLISKQHPVVSPLTDPSRHVTQLPRQHFTGFFNRNASYTQSNSNDVIDDVESIVSSKPTMSYRKQSEILEAKKMFDSVFDGIF
ncbi:unnamed protein product [Clavelina lepadiformis]|uniref:DNA 3'-5' helicase n=1 Tax=Clavelina lepadiformis TaxID=159417 RepID=A0ABP0FBB1_CLALP